ncbi:MAG: hypothetical protein AAFP10_00455 [Pseudomonadota bacterium]
MFNFSVPAFSHYINKYMLIALLSVIMFLFVFEVSDSVLPGHDTMLVFQYFDFVYSHLHQYKEIPRWLPDSVYGLPAALYQISFLNINKYLVILFGILFDVQNVLLLYKSALLLDRVIFIVGVYFLSTVLYQSTTARWYLCLSAIGSLSIYHQVFFNFYLFYLIPILLYLVVSFFKTGKIAYLVAGSSVGLLHFWGHTVYFIPLQFYVLSAVFLIYAILAFPKNIIIKKTDYLFLAIGAGFLAFLIYLVYQSVNGMTSVAHARNSDFSVGLEDFLTYQNLNFFYMLKGYISGHFFNSDNTYYVGILPLFLMLYGLIKSKSPGFWIFSIVALLIFSFSIGGYFSTLYYHLPGINRYRHIGLVFGFFSFFILIASGFLIEELLKKAKPQFVMWLQRFFFILLFLVACDLVLTHSFTFEISVFKHGSVNMQVSQSTTPLSQSRFFVFILFIKLVFFLAIISLRRFFHLSAKYYIRFIVLFFLSDMAVYQFFVIKNIPQEENNSAVFSSIKKYDFSGPRNKPAESTGQPLTLIQSFADFIRSYPGTAYDVALDWANARYCINSFRSDRWNPYILSAVRARGGTVTHHNDESFFPENDSGFMKSMGCESPRFYFGRSFRIAASDEIKEFARIVDPSEEILLHHTPALLRLNQPLAENASFEILYHSAHKVRIRAMVPGNKPALLVYADAWDPRWSAIVNGQETQVMRANIGIKALELAPGENMIELEFVKHHPMTFFNNISFFLAVFIMSLCLLLFIFEYRKLQRTDDSQWVYRFIPDQ